MKLLFIILLSCQYLVTMAQDTSITHQKQEFERNAFLISLGHPLFGYPANIFKRNFSFSLNYQYRFLKSFSLEPFYLYAQNNSYPAFFNDEVRLDRFIRGIKDYNFYLADWAEIYVHSLGVRLHFAFVHNPRWYFSFNFATGYLLSLSSSHSISSVEPSVFPPHQAVNYETSYYKRWNNGFFIMPGLLLKYSTKNRFLFGLHLTGYFYNDPKGIYFPEDIPVFPDHWNASLVFGKAF